MSDPILEVTELKTYFYTRSGVVKAVDGVSFSVGNGEIVGLVGESGSGKSVTGFSLLGLVDQPGRIVSGSIKLNGEELIGKSWKQMRALRGSSIAMVFQDPMATLNPVLKIGTQMRLALDAHEKLSRQGADARCIDVLTRVGIPEARARLGAYPHEFSGGMRQRVAIAIALLHGSQVLIADEPTTALDVSIQAQILTEMRDLAAESGTALVWISHDLAAVSTLANRLLVMYAGRIVEQGPIAAVLNDPYHPYTAGLLRSLPASTGPGEELQQIPGTAPSLLDPPLGCPFCPRCDNNIDLCATDPPLEIQGDRGFRCFNPLAEAGRSQ